MIDNPILGIIAQMFVYNGRFINIRTFLFPNISISIGPKKMHIGRALV